MFLLELQVLSCAIRFALYSCKLMAMTIPRLIATQDLSPYFRSNGIAFVTPETLSLGFGQGNKQYCLYSYPGPRLNETMGVFCEWHTEDFFETDTGPHFAIGMRGPVEEHPHRGRGLAIGVLANAAHNAESPDHPIPLFEGCPDPPGGPSFFLEDFTINDGMTPIEEWQLSLGQDLPRLKGGRTFRIDVEVSCGHVWAGVWEVTTKQSSGTESERSYTFLGQANCSDDGPGYSGNPASPCPESPLDKGRGNAFIGAGFQNPETRSYVDNIYIAHWKSKGAGADRQMPGND